MKLFLRCALLGMAVFESRRRSATVQSLILLAKNNFAQEKTETAFL